MRAVGLVTSALLAFSGAPLPAGGTIDLPTPEAARVQQSQLILAVGGRPDRLKHSTVPGKVVNDEAVLVGLGGDGAVLTVDAEQRLDVEGVGDYAIRERGPARQATSLSDEPPPITQRGAVVWQGFTPGRRLLAAKLRLDPAIEATHLPLTVALVFTGADGKAHPLADGGAVPGAGTVTITVTNVTSQPQDLPSGSDVSAALVAPHLDRALQVARHPSATRLPSTDDGLPQQLEVTAPVTASLFQSVPMRLTGSVRVTGATGRLTGPATTAAADGGSFAGTLGSSAPTSPASVTFTLATDGPGTVALDLTAVDALNATELAPPRGLPSWAAWAAANPPSAERKAALDLLVDVAATGARASSYSPYLGADLVGSGSTSFHFALAPPSARVLPRAVLHPRWGRLSLAGAAGLLLLVGGWAVWRRS